MPRILLLLLKDMYTVWKMARITLYINVKWMSLAAFDLEWFEKTMIMIYDRKRIVSQVCPLLKHTLWFSKIGLFVLQDIHVFGLSLQAFRAGDFQEAIVYYSRSISLLPNPPSYNNRALACKSLSLSLSLSLSYNRALTCKSLSLSVFLSLSLGLSLSLIQQGTGL